MVEILGNGARCAVSGHPPLGLRVRLRKQRIGRSLEKMLKLMIESDPWMLVLLEKGDVWRRKVSVDKSAGRYADDPGHDIPFPKQ